MKTLVALCALACFALAVRWLRARSEAAVLELVRREGPISSLRAAQLLGMWVYPVLRRLERNGALTSWMVHGAPNRGSRPRRFYGIGQGSAGGGRP